MDWRVVAGFVVSAVAVVLVLQQVDLGLVAHHVAASDPRFLAILVASVPATLWMKAARWRLFFRSDDPVTTRGLFSAISIGYMVSVIAPLRAGEVVRVILVADRKRLQWSRVLATVVVEKVLDVIAVALLMVALAAVFPLPEWATQGAVMVGLLLVVGLGGLVALIAAERALVGLVLRLEIAVPLLQRVQLGGLLISFNQGFSFVRNVRALARVMAWTAAIWLVGAVTMWAALIGTGVPASVAAALFLLTITNLGMVVPSAPGYVGYYHSLVVVSLAAFGVGASHALGTGLVLHGLTYGTVLLLGLLFLWRGQYGLGSLLRVSRQPSAVSQEPSAISRQPSAVSHQPSAVSHQPSAVSRQPSAVSHQPPAIGGHPSNTAEDPDPAPVPTDPATVSPEPKPES